MNININDLTVTRKSLVVSIEAAEVENEHKAVLSQFLKLAQLPGFRPGKAPAALVTKRFANDIDGEFKQKVVALAYKAVTEQKNLQIASIINIEDTGIEAGKPATITVTVDVQPDFELPEYNGLATEITAVEVTDAEVDSVIENVRAERAQFKTADRASVKGDYLKLSYEGKVDGQLIAEIAPDRQVYSKVPQTWEEVDGQHEGVIPGLGKELAGLKAGDKKDVTVQFPADFSAVTALAGKTAVYSVEVQEVRERILPEMDAEFLKANQAESVDGLKASVRENLKAQKDMKNRQAQRRQVLDAIISKVEVPLPESLLQQETNEVLRQFVTENMRRGISQEQMEQEKEKILETAKTTAAQRVKSQFILTKIAEKEKIEVAERDFDTYIYRETMRTGEKPEKIIKQLTNDRDLLRSVQRGIICDKAVDFLVTKANVTTVESKA